jgi:hypothetical protein
MYKPLQTLFRKQYAGAKRTGEKEAAVKAITELSKIYDINFVMTFGGEPLLYADTICAIHETK